MVDPPPHGRRIAFFGGSFDPPHRGHLAVARAARAALRLDTVLFAPVAAQPLKPLGSTADFEDRLAMTRLAIAAEPGFAVSLADAPGPADPAKNPNDIPNYTIDTLLRMRAELPAGDTLFCLLGADSFLGLRRWHRGGEIPFVAPLIVASRPGEDLADLAAVLPAGLSLDPYPAPPTEFGGVEVRGYTLRNPGGAAAPFYLLPGLHVEISASEIRRQVRPSPGRLAAGHELVPHAVAEYIADHGLYR
ncbi:MAG TPA: nicotinate (nicotinamide) nucleotide adenylyltransferase [Candidatus Sulfopaludibacter sp.]|nr:nicotinate (nicotinamide) nucleotide adenylyltransferase [Candidatus Sulfopaludibacter sp.]